MTILRSRINICFFAPSIFLLHERPTVLLFVCRQNKKVITTFFDKDGQIMMYKKNKKIQSYDDG
ncbi:hypothetical protein QTP88_024286 [Uroleucon formosanum]